MHSSAVRSTKPMRIAKIGYLASAGALCALGLLLLIYPAFSMRIFGLVLGILLIVFGAVKLVGYFSKDLYRLAFQHDLAGGILLIVLGLMLLVRPETAVAFFCIVFGLLSLLDALAKLRIAREAKQFGIRSWWVLVMEGIAAGVLGTLVVFRPGSSAGTLTVLFGLTLLAEGLLNMTTALTMVKITRNQKPDALDDLEDAE